MKYKLSRAAVSVVCLLIFGAWLAAKPRSGSAGDFAAASASPMAAAEKAASAAAFTEMLTVKRLGPGQSVSPGIYTRTHSGNTLRFLLSD